LKTAVENKDVVIIERICKEVIRILETILLFWDLFFIQMNVYRYI